VTEDDKKHSAPAPRKEEGKNSKEKTMSPQSHVVQIVACSTGLVDTCRCMCVGDVCIMLGRAMRCLASLAAA